MSNQSESIKKDEETRWWKKVVKKNSIRNWLIHDDKAKWLKDMRGMLSLVTTVIATMTFQAAINPPGGIRPAEETGNIECPDSTNLNDPCPGQSVLAIIYPDEYTAFLYCNTVCFVSSLVVCLFLVSGLPLVNRFFTWLFSIATCITLVSLSLTYLYSAYMVTPDRLWRNSSIFTMFGLVILIWIILIGIFALLLSLRLIFWLLAKWNQDPTQQPDP